MNLSRVRSRGWGTVAGLLALTLLSAPMLARRAGFSRRSRRPGDRRIGWPCCQA